MKEFFEREEIEETDDPDMRDVQKYLGEYQRQTSIEMLKIYGPVTAVILATALLAKGCDSAKQHDAVHHEPDNSGQTVSK